MTNSLVMRCYKHTHVLLVLLRFWIWPEQTQHNVFLHQYVFVVSFLSTITLMFICQFFNHKFCHHKTHNYCLVVCDVQFHVTKLEMSQTFNARFFTVHSFRVKGLVV
jgi:hypothetical protein